MAKPKPEYTAAELERLNRKIENAVSIHLGDGVRRMRHDLAQGEAQDRLHDAIKTGNFSKLNGYVPFEGFGKHVDKAADKLGELQPLTREKLRRGIKGGITGKGRKNTLLTKPLVFDAKTPGRTVAQTSARSAVHAQARRSKEATANRQDALRARLKRYMKDLFGPQKSTIKQAVAQGVQHKLSVPDIAKRIRGNIGLTKKQSQAVDKTFDGALAQGLSKAEAHKLADAHSERLLDYRAETIAITETRTLSETIKTGEWLTLERDGLMGENPTVTWILGALDDKTCPICIAAEGTQMPLGENFTLISGVECLPGFAHPRCRCYSMLTTDDDSQSGGKDNVDSRGEDFESGGEDVDAIAGRA